MTRRSQRRHKWSATLTRIRGVHKGAMGAILNRQDGVGPTGRPFLRWAGAKRAFVGQLSALVPLQFDTYYEPFMGAASLFFFMKPAKAKLSDSATELVKTFRDVRNDPHGVHAAIAQWGVDRETYYEVRRLHNLTGVSRSARFIYLNKTCWNGLYRVNKSGQFNVPFGLPKSQNIVSLDDLLSCSKSLQSAVAITCTDFEQAVEDCRADDFVFFDPPYVTSHSDTGFKDYNETLFSWDDQKRLAECAHRIARKGTKVLVTNADHPAITSLYHSSEVHRLYRHSTLAGSGTHRRAITELVIKVHK